MKRALVSFVLLLMLGGCTLFKPQKDCTRYYMLSGNCCPVAGVTEVEMTVMVNRVRVADYLEGDRIITMAGCNELRMNDIHRWAEPLDEGVRRVLVENLVQKGIGASMHGGRADYELNVSVIDFKAGGAKNDVILHASYEVRDNKMNRDLVVNGATVRVPLRGKSYNALAMSMSDAVAALTDKIVEQM